MRIENYELEIKKHPPSKAVRATRTLLQALARVLIMLMAGFAYPIFASDGYEFVIYPVATQAEIDALDIDFGAPRVHPGGTLRLTNRNGNLPFSSLERASLDEIDDLIFVGSDSVGVYLDENGWNDE